VWTYADVKRCNNCAENIWRHRRKFIS